MLAVYTVIVLYSVLEVFLFLFGKFAKKINNNHNPTKMVKKRDTSKSHREVNGMTA